MKTDLKEKVTTVEIDVEEATVLDILRDIIAEAEKNELWPKGNEITKLINLNKSYTVEYDEEIIGKLFTELNNMVDQGMLMFGHDVIADDQNGKGFCEDRVEGQITGNIASKNYYGLIQSASLNYNPEEHKGLIWNNADINIFYNQAVTAKRSSLEIFTDCNIIQLKSDSNQVFVDITVGMWSNSPLNHLASKYIQEKGAPITDDSFNI